MNIFKNINWSLRFKNPVFYGSFVFLILSTLSLTPEHFTSWEILIQELFNFVSNPFRLFTFLGAFMALVVDITTKGITDSPLVNSYEKPYDPKKDDIRALVKNIEKK